MNFDALRARRFATRWNIALAVAALLTFILLGAAVMATEEAAYTVSLSDGAFEVRDYPPHIAAQVRVNGDRQEAINAGFKLLAGYIFGANTRGQSIAMTAPVEQVSDAGIAVESVPVEAACTSPAEAESWLVRFVMPRGLTMDTLPAPNDPTVKLLPMTNARVAAIRFSGLAGEAAIASNTMELLAWMAVRRLQPAGTPSLARYNPPWTLWFMRRNEILVTLRADAPD